MLWGGVKKRFNIDFNPKNFNLDELSRKYAGVPLADLTQETADKLSAPAGSGETNKVPTDITEMRDRRAIEAIQEAKQHFKKIFVTAGSNHALTWEPALKEIYK